MTWPPVSRPLIDHFDDLNQAHKAVLKARQQIEKLTPLVADCDRHAELAASTDELRACREALTTWFAGLKQGLLEKRLAARADELGRHEAKLRRLTEAQRNLESKAHQLRENIARNGGDRIERIGEEIRIREEEQQRRRDKADRHAALLEALDLPRADAEDVFRERQRQCAALREETEQREAELQNKQNELGVVFSQKRGEHEQLQAEIAGLKARRSNIDEKQVAMRRMICSALDLPEEGHALCRRANPVCATRSLTGKGPSSACCTISACRCWVPDPALPSSGRLGGRHPPQGGAWFISACARRGRPPPTSLRPDALGRKVAVKPDSAYYDWLEGEIAKRFDVACCDTQDQFRRETRAVTRGRPDQDAGRAPRKGRPAPHRRPQSLRVGLEQHGQGRRAGGQGPSPRGTAG